MTVINKEHLNNSFVIMPMGLPWNWTTDYYEQTARVLSQRTIVFCIDLYSPTHILNVNEKSGLKKRFVSITKNLHILQPIDFVPFRRFSFVKSLNELLRVVAVIIIIYLKYPSFIRKKPVVWICDPRFAYFASMLRYLSTVIYDIVDFNQGIQQTQVENIRCQRDDFYLTKNADVVSVNSKTLFSIYKKRRSNIILVPQGFRLAQFKAKVSNPPKIHDSHKKNIIGYVGGINYRLDYLRILEIAEQLPDCLFVFVGKIQLDVDEKIREKILNQISQLEGMPNVRLVTTATKGQIPSIIKSFDIGIIPYDDSLTFNRYCFPMKLFEYFYFGKPVISSYIHELKYFSKYVHMMKTTQEWVWAIKKNLAASPTLTDKKNMRKMASSNSWESKLQMLYPYLG